MVSKDTGRCTLPSPDSEVEPAACLALEMRYALDANRQVKRRNKALQVRFKDICDAQSEQRDPPPPGAPLGDRREPRPPASHRAACRKYMTVPARRSIPNVTRSTGVQTSPDLRKCYPTFPPDHKRGSLKGLRGQDNGLSGDGGGEDGPGEEAARPWGPAGRLHTTTALVVHAQDHMGELEPLSGPNCTEPDPQADGHSCGEDVPPREPPDPLPGACGQDGATPAAEEPGRGVFETEVVAAPAVGASEGSLPGSAAASQWSLCPAGEDEQRRAAQLNGLQGPQAAATCSPPMQCLSPEWSQRPLQTRAGPGEDGQPCPEEAGAAGAAECQQIVPHTEVVGLKAQLQAMESLISSSQETIKVLLEVIQELEKGEAHREGLSYRTGQDTANCDTCRNSACIIYSVELDFKQQEDKLQPVLRKLHPFEGTQVAPTPYSQETPSTTTPKQKSKTESKKHGRWKLWFL